MNFSIRRAVHFDNFDRWLSSLEGIPIELALPHDMNEFLPDIAHLDELARYVKDRGLIVRTIHAPQGRLSGPSFMEWALPAARFSDRTGAASLVFHPENNSSKQTRLQYRDVALSNIASLQKETRAAIAIETFRSTKRVITVAEIMEYGLPMVLDTSHLFRQHTLEVIEQYSHGIVGVHLSENRINPDTGSTTNHMPVEEFGVSVLEALQDKGWEGNVTLEYLPQFHDRLVPDRKWLEEMFGGQGRGVQYSFSL